MAKGFSLVELSIVLVILGLLIGGVLTGQALIKAAELRSITTSVSKYQTAVNSFRDKYQGLPGDITNATQFWGSMSPCPPPAGSGGQTPAELTCDGNGDGMIGGQGNSYNQERLHVWQQLAAAGLIEGVYTGVGGPRGDNGLGKHLKGENCPFSRDEQGCWAFINIPADGDFNSSFAANWGNYFPMRYGNVLILGAGDTARLPVDPIIVPEDMWNVDVKFDDGNPTQGQLVVSEHLPDCYIDNSGVIEYDFSHTIRACMMVFRIGM